MLKSNAIPFQLPDTSKPLEELAKIRDFLQDDIRVARGELHVRPILFFKRDVFLSLVSAVGLCGGDVSEKRRCFFLHYAF